MPTDPPSTAVPDSSVPDTAAPTATAPTAPTATVTAADIARLAEVRRAAVSNWRRRFPDFPTPVGGTAANPLFALSDVEAWFDQHDKPFHVSALDRLWQQTQAAADDIRLGDVVGLLGVFFLLRERSPENRPIDPDADNADAIRALLPELPPALLQRVETTWTALLTSAAALTDTAETPNPFDYLCERYFATHSRHLQPTATDIADLMAELAHIPHQGTILDPACGTGTLLLAARARGAGRLLGQDSDQSLARIGLVRQLLAHAPAEVAVGDSLRADGFPGELVDAVLCDPPLHPRSWGHEELIDDDRWLHGVPPRAEPELAWLQHCLAHLKPGGHAVVLTPPAVAARRSGRRIRANLLRSGSLRAIITLPEHAGGASQRDLWVLRRAPEGDIAPTHLLLAAQPPDLDTIRNAWHAFIAGATTRLPGPSVAVPVIDLLDDEVDLNPARHYATSSSRGADRIFLDTHDQLVHALDELGGTLPTFTRPAQAHPLPRTTVADLDRSGQIGIHQAPLRMSLDGGELPVLTVNDLRLGQAPSGTGTRDRGTVLIQPGDVLVPLSSRNAEPHVTELDGVALGPQIILLRPEPEKIDPHFLAGFLRIAHAQATAGSTRSGRFDARGAAIPRLPFAAQQQYGAAFRRLRDLQQQLHRISTLGDELVRSGMAGLGHGRLVPEG